MEPNWLPPEAFIQAAAALLPGLHVVSHAGLMSALEAPVSAYVYGGQTDIYVLAGLYAQRIAKAHAFADGNKRAALLAAITFLELNGETLQVAPDALAEAMVGLANERLPASC